MTTRGIDVSHWQGNVDWFQVAQSDVKFAFAKATDNSTGVDAQFLTNGPQSKAVCTAFQRDHGLTPDGIVGARTWAAIFAA